MSFLTPLFLFGAAAVVAPVLFHLIRRTTRQRAQFSSLMFLNATPPRLTRRSRLENVLLLLLRCAVLCLLAFAFARPFFQSPAPELQAVSQRERTEVLLDVSASMWQDGLWPAAVARAEAIVQKAGPADEVALFSFARGLTPLVSFEEWRSTPLGDRAALARTRLKDVGPGWEATVLDQALIQAAERIEDKAGDAAWTRREVVVISDYQEGSRVAALQAHEWPADVEVTMERVTTDRAGNAGVQWLGDSADQADAGTSTVRVRINNAADSGQEQLQIGWAGQGVDENAETVYVPAGQSRTVALKVPQAGAAPNCILLRGDQQDFDNRVFVIPPVPTRATVLYVGDERADDVRSPLYFLGKAFPETRRLTVKVVQQPSQQDLTLNDLAAADLVVVAGGLSDRSARALRQVLSEGKTVLMAPVHASAGPGVAATLGIDSLALEEMEPRGYAMLAEVDFAHPLFAPFADSRFSDFTSIHFWKYRKLDAEAIPGGRILARFDTGDAAILEVPVGSGRVILFTSGWHPADSQLALSSKFVPLMFSLLDLSGAVRPPADQYFVGDAIPLPDDFPGTVLQPDGSTATVPAGHTEFRPSQPGVHTLTSGTTTMRVAVNLAAGESRTAPLPEDELERLGVPLARSVVDPGREVERRVTLHNTELEARQKLWRWLLLGALGMVLGETALAGWTARRATAPTEEVA